MNFHLEFSPQPFATKINHQDKLLLIGSCFTENIGNKLKQLKFNIVENPNGILFNPISISNSILSYINNKEYTEKDLFYANECWNSWDHHTRFSNPNKELCLQNINQSQTTAHQFLKSADWVFITIGSAFIYTFQHENVVANCHKIPIDKFTKKLLSIDEIVTALQTAINALTAFNPKIKIIFTISPVRHLRDGFVENNRSKAALIQAIHYLVDNLDNSFYFPAYELVMDDLRDYRFYAEDMVHPNYAATNYVWEKFISTCIAEPALQLMKQINLINAAKNHKPFHPTSEQHKHFLSQNLLKVQQLHLQNQYIDFEEEINYFTTN